MNIIGTGLSGLVGSRLVDLLPQWEFENLSLETGVDITHRDEIIDRISQSKASWVFHFAAYTDVDHAERQKELKQDSLVWQVNVLGTQNVVEACRRAKKKLLYISTDYVFDGTKEEYTEHDPPHPQSWYAITKYEGEKSVQTLAEQGLVIRIANPYRAHPIGKADFVHKILILLSQHQEIISPSDQIFVPTFIDDIAHAMKSLVENNAYGIYHVVGSDALSPYEAALQIAMAYGYSRELIQKTEFADYFSGRAPRPYHANVKNDKITKRGIFMSTFKQGLARMNEQENQ